MKIIATLNPEGVTDDEASHFDVRTAVRGIVYDEDHVIAVLNVSKQTYHKLPGGGMEEGEDAFTALKRECREELGCAIEICDEVGQIIEYRKKFKLKQISSCYTAKVIGEKGKPNFTQEELDNGFQVQWMPIERALDVLKSDEPLDEEGRMYIVPRDIAFIRVAKVNGSDDLKKVADEIAPSVEEDGVAKVIEKLLN